MGHSASCCGMAYTHSLMPLNGPVGNAYTSSPASYSW